MLACDKLRGDRNTDRQDHSHTMAVVGWGPGKLGAWGLGLAAEARSGEILKGRFFGWKERVGPRKPPPLFGEVG